MRLLITTKAKEFVKRLHGCIPGKCLKETPGSHVHVQQRNLIRPVTAAVSLQGEVVAHDRLNQQTRKRPLDVGRVNNNSATRTPWAEHGVLRTVYRTFSHAAELSSSYLPRTYLHTALFESRKDDPGCSK